MNVALDPTTPRWYVTCYSSKKNAVVEYAP